MLKASRFGAFRRRDVRRPSRYRRMRLARDRQHRHLIARLISEPCTRRLNLRNRRARFVTTSKEGACPKLNHDPCIFTHLIPLIADLVSGRPVQTGARERFVLPDSRTRSALEWYRKKGSAGWTANVSAQHGEDLVDTVLQEPPELPALATRPANANNRRLRLKKLGAPVCRSP